jgi:hypothetical protein
MPEYFPRLLMSRRKVVAGSLSIVGAVVLVIALFVGWYVISASGLVDGTSEIATGTFYLGQTITGSSSCSGSFCPSSTPSGTSTYYQAGLNDTGRIYALMQILVLVALVLGIIGGALLFMAGNGRPQSAATYLILVALFLAVFAPVGLLVLQPKALTDDNYGHGNTSGPAPESSFFGSCSGTACGSGGGSISEVGTWGPGIGWYLALAAFGLFLVALVVGSTSPGRPAPSAGQPATGRVTTAQAQGPQPIPQLIACRTCGRVYALGQFSFCSNCGAKLG